MPEVALMRAARPGFQSSCELTFVYAAIGRGYFAAIAFGYLEIRKPDDTTMRRPIAKKQSGFQADEGHRHIRLDRRSEHIAGVAVDSGWNVELHDPSRMRIDLCNCVRKITADLAFQATTEDAVDKQVGLIIKTAGPGHDHSTFGGKIAPGGGGIAG